MGMDTWHTSFWTKVHAKVSENGQIQPWIQNVAVQRLNGHIGKVLKLLELHLNPAAALEQLCVPSLKLQLR